MAYRILLDYMYSNYQFKETLLKADLESFNASGHEYGTKYYQSLWSQSGSYTVKLMTNSSKSTAELIRTAWIEAGRPRIPKEISFDKLP